MENGLRFADGNFCDLFELVVNPLDDAVIGKAVIIVVEKGHDQMLMNLDIQQAGRFDDFLGYGHVFRRGLDVRAGVVVRQYQCRRISQDGSLEHLPRCHLGRKKRSGRYDIKTDDFVFGAQHENAKLFPVRVSMFLDELADKGTGLGGIGQAAPVKRDAAVFDKGHPER